MKLLSCAFLCLLTTGSGQTEDDCSNFSRLLYGKPGNITITGIFDGNEGENCSSPSEFGVQEMAAAVWTVTALERYDYLPGIRIGLYLFDACGTTKMAHEAFAEAVLHESCHNGSSLGMLTTPEIDAKLTALSQKLNRTITKLEHMLDLDGLLTMVAELLTNLHWTTVNRVIADSHDVLDRFSLRMSEEGVCVYDEALSSDRYAVNGEVLMPVDVPNEEVVSKDVPVIVVMCRSDSISRVLTELTRGMKTLPVRWLLAPTDFVLNVPEDELPEKVFSILPLVDKKERLLRFITDEDLQKDHMNHREATRSPLFVKTAVAILELLKPFRAVHENSSEMMKLIADQSNVAPLPVSKVTPQRIMNALNVLRLDANDNEPFLYIASLVRRGERVEDAAIFQLFDTKTPTIKPVPLIVNERLFNEGSRTKRSRIFRVSVDDLEKMKKKEVTDPPPNEFAPFDKHPCLDVLTQDDSNLTRSCGICQNFVRFHVRSTRATAVGDGEEDATVDWSWRSQTWVAINASVASIGAICTLAVIAFILLRICKGDILEGSPYFSFLILISILFLYASTILFSVEESERTAFMCRFRIIAPTVGYAALFSIILSRSTMVILTERDGGIMNHVNGLLQCVLCFFMGAVQVALTVQFCVYHAVDGFDCSTVHENHNFIVLLAYSFFLLSLLSLVAPFTMRSKRNYREGTYFSIATLLVVVVWSVWLSLYYVLPVAERDAAVVLGLTATATSVLLSVFIPRTYLMATATVRDKITNTLPSLAYINASNVSEVNYRSNQALYDSVTVKYGSPKLSFSNSRIYSVHMSSSAPASPSHPTDGVDYVLNRRKTFIEVSSAESPENSYRSRETPDLTGKITRF